MRARPRLHYNVAAGVSAGTGNVESVAGGLSTLAGESTWETYNQGPVGFQALGATSGGAAAIVARVRVPSAALIASASRTRRSQRGYGRANRPAPHRVRPPAAGDDRGRTDDPHRRDERKARGLGRGWSGTRALAGQRGLDHAGGSVRRAVWSAPSSQGGGYASAGGTQDQRTITIVRPAPQRPTPTVYLPAESRAGAGAGEPGDPLPPPQTMFVGRDLVITTGIGEAGRATIAAYSAGRRLGGCAAQTPAGRNFTCVLSLPTRSVREPIRISTSLQVGHKVLRSGHPSAPIGPMTMVAQQLRSGSGYSLQFVCSPLLATASTASR